MAAATLATELGLDAVLLDAQGVAGGECIGTGDGIAATAQPPSARTTSVASLHRGRSTGPAHAMSGHRHAVVATSARLRTLRPGNPHARY
jgi:hypothetical protein